MKILTMLSVLMVATVLVGCGSTDKQRFTMEMETEGGLKVGQLYLYNPRHTDPFMRRDDLLPPKPSNHSYFKQFPVYTPGFSGTYTESYNENHDRQVDPRFNPMTGEIRNSVRTYDSITGYKSLVPRNNSYSWGNASPMTPMQPAYEQPAQELHSVPVPRSRSRRSVPDCEEGIGPIQDYR